MPALSVYEELKALAQPLAEIASFHLQVAARQALLDISPSTTQSRQHSIDLRFYELLKQKLELLSQHLQELEAPDIEEALLRRLQDVSELLDQLISRETLLSIWKDFKPVS